MADEERNLKLVREGESGTTNLPAIREVGMPMIPDEKIGAIKLSDKEREILDRPAETDRVLIRPDPQQDGRPTLYLSHEWYRDRLREALGFGAFGFKTIKIWGEEVDERSGKKSILIYVWAALYVRGCFVADSIGSHKYHPDNRQMDYSDAVKAAKSNAFVRCCSDAGLGLEPWQQKFREEFAAEHCIRVTVKEDGKAQPRWRRKDARPFENEVAGVQNDPNKVPPSWQTGAQSNSTGAGLKPGHAASEEAPTSGAPVNQQPSSASATNAPLNPAPRASETVIDLDAAAEKQPCTEEQLVRLKELTVNLNPQAVQNALKVRRVKTFEELSVKQAANIIEKLTGATA